MSTQLAEGAVLCVRRRITAATVAAFGETTGDLATHHLTPHDGQLAVHGGYLGSMIPLLGGREYIVRKVVLEFVAPAYVGDELVATTVIRSARPAAHLGTIIEGDVKIVNQQGATVVRGTVTGISPRS